MSAFDNPPKGDPNDVPDHLWLAYCRAEVNREERRYRITDYSAWPSSMAGLPFDARKYYLANFGPMAMGFTVYEDFDSYGGGVFKHVTGNVARRALRARRRLLRHAPGLDLPQLLGHQFRRSRPPRRHRRRLFMIAYGDSNIDDTFYGCHGVLVPPQSRLAQRVGDVDGDGKTEVLVTSPWGIGILKQAGARWPRR